MAASNLTVNNGANNGHAETEPGSTGQNNAGSSATLVNPNQHLMFLNPSQGQFSGSTLHHGSSRHLLGNKNGGQIGTGNNGTTSG